MDKNHFQGTLNNIKTELSYTPTAFCDVSQQVFVDNFGCVNANDLHFSAGVFFFGMNF